VERFQKLLKALFFCPIPKMLKAPSIEGAFSFQRHPYRGSHREWGTGGGGVGWVPGQTVRLGRGVFLREHTTQPGTLERNCRDIGVRRL